MHGTQEALILSLTALDGDPPRHLIGDPPRGTVEDRWNVYAHGYMARIEEALSNDYRAVRRVLGEGAFQSLLLRYLRRFPPQSYDLAHAGERLPRFLETDPLTKDLPFLPDLARLEWRMVESFVAEERPALTRADLSNAGPLAAAEIRFALQPSASLIRSSWPLAEIWALWNRPDDQVSVELEGPSSAVLVHRRGWPVFCEAIEDDDATLVEAASCGTTLAETAALIGASDEVSIRSMLTCFARLVDRGIFRKVEEE